MGSTAAGIMTVSATGRSFAPSLQEPQTSIATTPDASPDAFMPFPPSAPFRLDFGNPLNAPDLRPLRTGGTAALPVRHW